MDGIEQRSSLYGLLAGKDKVGWEAAPAAQFDTGSSSDQRDSGACRGEGFVLSEDMPDGFGELAGDVDPGNLGATLAAEAVLVALVAVSIADITSGVGGSLDERPAQVLGPVLGQWPTDSRGCPTGARSDTALCSR